MSSPIWEEKATEADDAIGALSSPSIEDAVELGRYHAVRHLINAVVKRLRDVEEAGPGGAIALDDLSDVVATGGSTGDVLTQQGDGSFALEAPTGGSQPVVQDGAPTQGVNTVFSVQTNSTISSGTFRLSFESVTTAAITGATATMTDIADAMNLAYGSDVVQPQAGYADLTTNDGGLMLFVGDLGMQDVAAPIVTDDTTDGGGVAVYQESAGSAPDPTGTNGDILIDSSVPAGYQYGPPTISADRAIVWHRLYPVLATDDDRVSLTLNSGAISTYAHLFASNPDAGAGLVDITIRTSINGDNGASNDANTSIEAVVTPPETGPGAQAVARLMAQTDGVYGGASAYISAISDGQPNGRCLLVFNDGDSQGTPGDVLHMEAASGDGFSGAKWTSLVTFGTDPPGSDYTTPLIFDDSPSTGGLYAWNGSAYAKIAPATS